MVRIHARQPFDALSLAHGRPFDAIAANARGTGHIRKRVECLEQAEGASKGLI